MKQAGSEDAKYKETHNEHAWALYLNWYFESWTFVNMLAHVMDIHLKLCEIY